MANTPPHAAEQERAILGAVLRKPEILGFVRSTLSPGDFFIAKNRVIYRTILAVYERCGSIDQPMLIDEIMGTDNEQKVGGIEYVVDLTEGATPAHAEWYMDRIAEKSALRACLGVFSEGIDQIYSSNGNAGKDTLEAIKAQTFELFSKNRRGRPKTEAIGGVVTRVLQAFEDIGDGTGADAWLSTGFPDLDRKIGGLAPGKLYILAGRPSMGKTTFALNMARNISILGGLPGMVFSIEMDRESLAENLISAHAKINNQIFRDRIVSPRMCDKLASAASFISTRPLYLNDASSVGWSDIRSDFLLQNAIEPVKYVIVDYLQLMNTDRRAERRDLAVGEVARRLKVMAGEMEVPIILLSQLNRAVDNREGNRPRLSDLRDSGNIEEHADVVIFMNRPNFYNAMLDREAEAIVAKNRTGPIGSVPLVFIYEHSKFESLAAGEVDDV